MSIGARSSEQLRRALDAASFGTVCAALCSALALLSVGCADTTAIERGAALFSEPSLSGSPTNAVSCANCHATGAIPADWIPTGGSLAGVTLRPSFFGGGELDLRAAINFCLRRFMRAPVVEPLSADDPRGLDLLSYLETLEVPAGTVAGEAVPWTLGSIADDLPPGDATRGAVVWDLACRRCHGEPRTGAGRLFDAVAVLPDDTIEEHGAEARLRTIEKVRNGQFYEAGGDMAPFSIEALSDQQLADVLAHLRLLN